jgi:hypothetical protein
MSYPKTVSLDFDGVIHAYTSGWQGADVITDGPVHGAMAAILEYQAAGFLVTIYSSRSNLSGGVAAMHSAIYGWMQDHIRETFGEQNAEKVNHAISELYFPKEKPAAWMTIDDRAVQFKGVWPSVQEINDFKPWYK